MITERRHRHKDTDWTGTSVQDTKGNPGVVVNQTEGEHYLKLWVKFDDEKLGVGRILLSKVPYTPTNDALKWSWKDTSGKWYPFFNPKDKKKKESRSLTDRILHG